jgi:hypothetical protein
MCMITPKKGFTIIKINRKNIKIYDITVNILMVTTITSDIQTIA